jgi:hypothetical protein
MELFSKVLTCSETVKNVYISSFELVFQEISKASIKNENFSRTISKNILQSKFLHNKQIELLWKYTNGGQSSGVELQHYADVDPSCIWCSSTIDSLKHRYFSCAFLNPVWEAFKEIAYISIPEEDYLKKIGAWKAMNSKNKELKAQDFLAQVLYASTLWSIYSFFVKKQEEEITISTQEIINKAVYGGIIQLAQIIKKIIKESETKEEAGKWKIKAILIRRLIQTSKSKLSKSLSNLFDGLINN